MKRIQRLLQVLYSVVSVAIIIVCSYLIFGRVVLKYETIRLGNYSLYTVTSGSMEPEIQVGDLVVVRSENDMEYRMGDIITFKDEYGSTVTHRIKSQKNGRLVTRGDANNVDDLPITEADIKGKVVRVIHLKSKVILFLSEKRGRQLLAVVGLILIWFHMKSRGNKNILTRKKRGEEM